MDHRLLLNCGRLCQVNETQDHVTFAVHSISQRDALTLPADEYSGFLVLEESLRRCCRFKKIEDFHDESRTSVVLEVRKQLYVDDYVCSVSSIPSGTTQLLLAVQSIPSSTPKFYYLKTLERDAKQVEFECPQLLEDVSQKRRFEVFGLDNHAGEIRFQKTTELEAEMTILQISELYEKAIAYAGSNSVPVRWFYRNKRRKYFDEILSEHNGIMRPYIKDDSGDPGSPINGRLNGLFFTASVKPGSKTGEVDARSSFGDTRLCVPTEDFSLPDRNLYFVDFYCMKTTKLHYVTLVVTRKDSEADRFCLRRLLPLSFDENPFLFYDSSKTLKVSASRRLIVECMFTEDIDVRGYELIHEVKTRGKGKSTKGGRPKNSSCTICNATTHRSRPMQRRTKSHGGTILADRFLVSDRMISLQESQSDI